MPRTTVITPVLAGLLDAQDGVVSSRQLLEQGFRPDAVQHRIGRGEWRRLLPGVILTSSGAPTVRQRVVAAYLWAGSESAIDGLSACRWYGVVEGTTDPNVHVVVPFGSAKRSQSFVVVRRTLGEIRIGEQSLVPYVEVATAVIVGARSLRSAEAAIGLLSRALQKQVVTVAQLADARERLGDKWCRRTDQALRAVGVGIRSPAENDARRLILGSSRLPEPEWNIWLDLGDGGPPVCVDALWLFARLVHEVNGKRYHAWDRTFEDMQRRHDRMTAAGLIVLHNAPTRIRREGPAVLGEIERTYPRYAGLGRPDGVRVVEPPSQLRIA